MYWLRAYQLGLGRIGSGREVTILELSSVIRGRRSLSRVLAG